MPVFLKGKALNYEFSVFAFKSIVEKMQRQIKYPEVRVCFYKGDFRSLWRFKCARTRKSNSRHQSGIHFN